MCFTWLKKSLSICIFKMQHQKTLLRKDMEIVNSDASVTLCRIAWIFVIPKRIMKTHLKTVLND